MAYFNHAFCKTLLSTAAEPAAGAPGATSADLAPATVGVINPQTWRDEYVDILANGRNMVLAMGSIMSQDKIGPFHGGS